MCRRRVGVLLAAWRRRRDGPNQAFFVSAVSPGPIALAGLWETWGGADGSEIDTACLLTIAADAALAPISARTPVVIAPTDSKEWLGSSDSVAALLRPLRADLFSACPVAALVESARNDGPDLVNPVGA